MKKRDAQRSISSLSRKANHHSRHHIRACMHACMHACTCPKAVNETWKREWRKVTSSSVLDANSFHGHVLFPVLAGRVACIESSYIYLAARQCRAGVPMYMSQLAYKTVAFALILEGRPRREWQSALLTVSFNPPNRRRLQPKSSPSPSSIASRRIKKINSRRYI